MIGALAATRLPLPENETKRPIFMGPIKHFHQPFAVDVRRAVFSDPVVENAIKRRIQSVVDGKRPKFAPAALVPPAQRVGPQHHVVFKSPFPTEVVMDAPLTSEDYIYSVAAGVRSLLWGEEDTDNAHDRISASLYLDRVDHRSPMLYCSTFYGPGQPCGQVRVPVSETRRPVVGQERQSICMDVSHTCLQDSATSADNTQSGAFCF